MYAIIMAGVLGASIGLGFSMGQTVMFKQPTPAPTVSAALAPAIDSPTVVPLVADPPAFIPPRALRSETSAVLTAGTPSFPEVMIAPPGSAEKSAPVDASAAAGNAVTVVDYFGISPWGPTTPGYPAGSARTASQGTPQTAFGLAPSSSKHLAAVPQATRYRVQVGVFSTWQEAEALVLRLKALGYAVRMKGDGSFYHVCVGGYLDQTTAQRLAQNLYTAGFEARLAQ